MSNTVRNIEISKAEEVGAAIIDEQPQDYSIVQEWADKLGIELPQESAHVTPIKELSALVNGLVRKVLNMFLPQIVNKTEETYSHLDSRCTDYTPAAYDPFRLPAGPYDPMRPFVPRTLPNLLTALTAFADRKISGVPDAVDGISLVHFLNIAPTIETLTDNTEGWTMVRNNLGMFTGLKHLQLGCDVIDVTPASYSNFIGTSNYEDLDLSKVKKVYIRNNSGCVSAPNAVVDLSGIEEFYGYTNYHSNGYALISACANESLDLSKLHKIESTGSAVGSGMAVPIVANSSALKNIDLSSMAAFNTRQQSANANKTYYFRNCPNVESIKVGKLTSFNSINFMCYGDDNTTMQKLVHFEIGAGTAISLNLAYWNPTYALQNQLSQFLQNFKEHILSRLSTTGGNYTLTLSQAVRDAIHDGGLDQYKPSNWTITPNPTNT